MYVISSKKYKLYEIAENLPCQIRQQIQIQIYLVKYIGAYGRHLSVAPVGTSCGIPVNRGLHQSSSSYS